MLNIFDQQHLYLLFLFIYSFCQYICDSFMSYCIRLTVSQSSDLSFVSCFVLQLVLVKIIDIYVKKEIIFVSCPFNVSIITSDNYSFWVQHLFFHPIQIMRLNQSIDRKIPLCQSSVKVMWPPNSDRVFESLAFKILLLIKLKIFLEITVPDNLTPFVTLLVVACHPFRD